MNVKKEVCRGCGVEIIPHFKLRPDTPHYAQLICPECDFALRWVPKPKNKTKRKKNKHNAKMQEIIRCELCQRTLDMLGTNEVIDCHHVIEIEQGGEDELSNIWWVCTSCHKEIHHRRDYMMRNQIETISLLDLRSWMDRDNVPYATRAVMERIFIKSHARREI